jgi:hypothetical protein
MHNTDGLSTFARLDVNADGIWLLPFRMVYSGFPTSPSPTTSVTCFFTYVH